MNNNKLNLEIAIFSSNYKDQLKWDPITQSYSCYELPVQFYIGKGDSDMLFYVNNGKKIDCNKLNEKLKLKNYVKKCGDLYHTGDIVTSQIIEGIIDFVNEN